jgi:UrcA family protein
MSHYTGTTIRQSLTAALAATMITAVSFVAIAPLPAHAEEVTRVAVSRIGYDLTNPAHAAKLARAIRSAADRACGGVPSIRELTATSRFHACKAQALADAAAQVGSPVLSAQLNVVPVHTVVAIR